MADYSNDPGQSPESGPRAGTVLNLVASLVSLGLLVGVGVWGYRLVMRDVTGIPVVQALDGPMRLSPDDPGGEVALHTGLSVYEVAAEGGAAGPEDVLVLAPATSDLTEEDLSVQPTAEAAEDLAGTPGSTEATAEAAPTEALVADLATDATSEPVTSSDLADTSEQVDPTAPVAASDGPLTAEQILALAEQIASGTTPLAPLEDEPAPEVETAINGVPTDVIADIVPSSVPGVSASLRPKTRPETLSTSVSAAVTDSSADPDDVIDPVLLISTETIPAGTSLAQLGAFDSPEIAAQEWRRLNGRFTDFMAGKDRLIQQAERGGRTFYRLRARGFEDLADARRFCAALMAGNADCVPVVER